MALPAHLQRYDGLIDLLVEQLVREIEQGTETEKAASDEPAASVTITSTPTKESRNHVAEYCTPAASAATP